MAKRPTHIYRHTDKEVTHNEDSWLARSLCVHTCMYMCVCVRTCVCVCVCVCVCDMQVDPQYYSFRWITLLLSQEFPIPDTLRIWDTILGDPHGRMDCLLRICTAMILNVKPRLMQVCTFFLHTHIHTHTHTLTHSTLGIGMMY